jgi:hypothetical protein
VALIVWDLLYINKTHLWQVEVSYPLIVLILFLFLLSFKLARERLKKIVLKDDSGIPLTALSRYGVTTYRRWIIYSAGLLVLMVGLYFLQCYRDTTRYDYYSNHYDHQSFINLARTLVCAWEYLDHPGSPKTIALAMDPATPMGRWLFYPLLGKRLQNDIVYLSAQYKWEVPPWMDRGILRGNDSEVWYYNLKKQKVDYIFVQEPWPVEVRWIISRTDDFALMFSDRYCRIYKYIGESL